MANSICVVLHLFVCQLRWNNISSLIYEGKGGVTAQPERYSGCQFFCRLAYAQHQAWLTVSSYFKENRHRINIWSPCKIQMGQVKIGYFLKTGLEENWLEGKSLGGCGLTNMLVRSELIFKADHFGFLCVHFHMLFAQLFRKQV